LVPEREELETNELGRFTIKEYPVGPIFVYDLETGERVEVARFYEKTYNTNLPYKTLKVDYNYNYENDGSVVNLG